MSLDCWGFCLDWDTGSRISRLGFWEDEQGKRGRAVPTPRRAGAKKGRAGRTRQGVAGQPGATLAVTVSLPCKLPTG